MEGKIEFAVFCIENIATQLHMNPSDVYKALAEKSNILNEYIIPGYDALHTQGKDYIVNDIVDVMREKGVCV